MVPAKYNSVPTEFNKIAQSILVRHKNIQALAWIPKVLNSEREAYEKKRRKKYPDFEITEREKQGSMIRAHERDMYFPVYYVEPLAGNEVAFGFDLASSPKRLKTLEMSRDLGTALATASITLVQEASNQKGFLTFMPIYKGQPATVEKRRERLRGFVLGVFRIGDMFSSAIKRTAAQGINLSLVDVNDSFLDILYVNHFSNEIELELQSKFKYQKQLAKFGGRQWSIIATPTNGYIAERRSILPYTTAIFGMLFVILGTAYTFVIIRRSALIEKTVLDRTKNLNDAKKQLEALSRTDSLTNIANRRCFDEYLEAEWKRAIREKSSLSLIMIDIDHFKLFNDRYGHMVGDECLRNVAFALQKSVHRSSDLVARYGGEEFVIIFPNTKDAFVPAENCRLNVENLRIPNEESNTSKYVTISIGIATIIPERHSELTEFTSKVDRALYEAKETGRNKVCVPQ